MSLPPFFLFTLFPWSRVGSLSWETVLNELLCCQSIPEAETLLQKLLQHGPFPWGIVLREWTAPVWVPIRDHGFSGHRSCQKTYSWMGSLWAAAAFKAHPAALMWGPSQSAGQISALLWYFMDCRGKTCVTMFFSTNWRGISALVPGTSPPLLWLCYLQVISLKYFLLLTLPAAAQHFLPFLKYVITKVLAASLVGSVLGSSVFVLDLIGTGSVQHRGESWCFLTKPITEHPLLSKP